MLVKLIRRLVGTVTLGARARALAVTGAGLGCTVLGVYLLFGAGVALVVAGVPIVLFGLLGMNVDQRRRQA